jgi:hypothetical protein
MPAHTNVTVVLIKNTTRESATRSFEQQEFEFDREPDTIKVGVDGHLGIGKHLTHAFWKGGRALDLKTSPTCTSSTRTVRRLLKAN